MQGADAGELAGMPGLVPEDDDNDSLADSEADGYASEEAGANEHGQSFIHSYQSIVLVLTWPLFDDKPCCFSVLDSFQTKLDIRWCLVAPTHSCWYGGLLIDSVFVWRFMLTSHATRLDCAIPRLPSHQSSC